MVQELKTKVWKSLFVEVPLEGTTAKFEDSTLTITGPKGEVSKKLRFPRVKISVENDCVKVGTEKFSQSQKKIIFTYRAHVNNMIKGVKEGFTYKLKVVYAKFPMTAQVKGNMFQVKNLLGEKVPRTYPIPADVKVTVNGADITVEGIDKEKTGQVAAGIEQSTRYTHLDRRVVQDGVFITVKPHKSYI